MKIWKQILENRFSRLNKLKHVRYLKRTGTRYKQNSIKEDLFHTLLSQIPSHKNLWTGQNTSLKQQKPDKSTRNTIKEFKNAFKILHADATVILPKVETQNEKTVTNVWLRFWWRSELASTRLVVSGLEQVRLPYKDLCKNATGTGCLDAYKVSSSSTSFS